MNTRPPPFKAARILVLDDEPDLRTLYELTLLREGHEVTTAGTLAQARALLAQQAFDLLLSDMRLPDGLGLELLHEIKQQQRPEKIIVITAFGSAESAVEALKLGAFDYLTKPVDIKQFRATIAAALQAQPPKLPTNQTEPAARAIDQLSGQSNAIAQIKDRIARISTSMAPVMILGESGTGKELVAKAIHGSSHRVNGTFVAVNCAAIPETLLEAEFFGAKKGAYTGATADRVGYFASAQGGTLFLDEVGDLPLAMQAKLLRVIQERKVRPLGSNQEEPVDVRLLCATHKNLNQLVEQGLFRQDLFYRLNVIEIKIPPLRERKEDLPTLISTLMQRIFTDHHINPIDIAPDALDWLMTQAYPGNVRELENQLHRAIALSQNTRIELHDVQDPSASEAPIHAHLLQEDGDPISPAETLQTQWPIDLQAHLESIERTLLTAALEQTKGNRTAAAKLLGLNLRQIRYRIGQLGIHTTGDDDAAIAPLD